MSNQSLPRIARMMLLLVLIALIGVGGAFAQGGSQGGVAGLVKDPSGAAIPDAMVTLKNVNTNETRTTSTSNEGAFSFALINNGQYTISVTKEGFATATVSNIQVLPAQQYSLNVVMKVGAKSETVEVVAGQELVNTTTSEIAGTVTQSQILNLPLLGRNPIELMRNQAGVPGILYSNREDTGINGGRPGWTQITQDGINIQDNFIRNNATDFVPSRPTSDTIGEFSVITNNVGSDSMGGASQVRLVTPNGTNDFHGGVYEYNRNSALSAYNFFSKRVNPVPKKPFLNQNQFGAKLGGPVLKNKLFFWGSYEGLRLRQQVLQNNRVPLNADYLTGTYRYGSSNTPVNVLNVINSKLAAIRAGGGTAPPNLAINPAIQTDVLSHYSTNGNSVACGDQKNTTCNSFNQGDPLDRSQVSFRFDYNVTDKHTLQFNYQRFWDRDARTDIDNVTPAAAVSSLSTTNILYSGAWRWTITPRLVNEFRGGDFSSVVPFLRGFPNPTYLLAPAANNAATLTGLGLTNWQTNFVDQGRNVATRQYMDNATYAFGNHNIQFGFNYQKVMPTPYNYASTLPTVTFGFAPGTSFSPYSLTTADIPGATQTDIDNMNAYAAFLAGAVSTVQQTYQVENVSSGFKAGYPNKRKYSYSIDHFYVKDVWRMRQNLSVTVGLKYEYWTPVSVADSLGLLPTVTGDLKTFMLGGNQNLAPVSRLWKPDRNQFAPSVGVAWTMNDKTVIRGGYALTFVNEDSITAAANALTGNFGLVGGVTMNSQAFLFSGAPTVPVPNFQPNRTFSQQLHDSGSTAAAFAIDPNLRTPSSHQISLGVQRELPWQSAVEVRYVGQFSRNLWRGVDYNQQRAASDPEFLADFNRARSNLILCGAAVAPSTCAQGQALTLLPTFELGGYLTNATVKSYLRNGQIGSLADLYSYLAYSDSPDHFAFPTARNRILPNPSIYGADAVINGGILNYNSLQVEFRKRSSHGLTMQANYTWSKDMSDTYGDSQNRFEPLLDNNRPGLNYSRSPFDINHSINVNFMYELPFGKGKSFFSGANSLVDKIIGGWATSTIWRFQTGSPFSIYSGYATFQRRSGDVQAYSTLSTNQIRNLFHIQTINGKTYWIDPSVISSTGRATDSSGLDYTPTFAGQVFFNPEPNQFGSYNKLVFSGPWVISWDATIRKSVKFNEAHPIAVTFASDFFNASNSKFYYVGDNSINSTTFGQTSSRGLQNRVIQMSLRVDF